MRFLGELGKGMFAGVVRNVKEKHFCKGIDCRFSYEYIGEKSSVVGYCLWCERDKMQKVMGIGSCRDCRFSYEYIGEKNIAVGYCIWCDRDIMLKAMEDKCFRNCHVKKGLLFFYQNDDNVFRMALARLPVEYRTYWHWKIRTPMTRRAPARRVI